MYHVKQINKIIMTFQEIFKEEGLYVGPNFSKGYCFGVDPSGFLYNLQYKDANDISPKRDNVVVFSGLFDLEYKKVYTRQSLFK